MQLDRNTNHAIFHLFGKRILKYLIVLIVLICMLIPVLIISYRSIRQDIVISYTNSINKGLNDLDSQISSVIKISTIIKEEECYRDLLRTVGPPKANQYIEINALQKKLSSLSVSHEYVKDMYILFKDNPIYISNSIADDNYNNIYPLLLREKDQSAASWHHRYFSDQKVLDVSSNAEVYSFYTASEDYPALICAVDIFPHTFSSKLSVLVCNINFQDFVTNMISPDILNDCILYISDGSNQMIAAHNLPEPLSAPDNPPLFDAEDYMMIYSEPSKLGYQVALGIPKNYLSSKAGASFFIIPCYFFVGLVFIFVLSLIFSLKETTTIKKVINTASVLFPSSDHPGNSANEYAYISGVLKTNATELDYRNHLLKTFALENLFLNSTQSGNEHSYIQELFPSSFDFYCVAVIKLEQLKEKTINRHFLFYLEESCQHLICELFLAAHTNVDELSVLIILDDTHYCDLSEIREELFNVLNFSQKQLGEDSIVHIGLSTITSGSDHIRESYLQAKDTIHIFADPASSGLFVYNKPRQIIFQKSIDVSLLMKCYDGILYGDPQVVQTFFEHIDRIVQKGYYDHQEPLQLLFSIRQPIYNAYIEIFASNESDNITLTLTPPTIELQQPLKHNIAALKDFALQLCAQIQLQKRSRQLLLRENIMDFVRTNCFDINFCIFTVANEFQVSENYVLQLIKESTGKSFKTFIENIRVEQAELLLRNTNDSNAKIAAACGFGSENTFYRAFARKHGVTPSKWSKN